MCDRLAAAVVLLALAIPFAHCLADGAGPQSPTVAAWDSTEKTRQRDLGTTLRATIKSLANGTTSNVTVLTLKKDNYRFASPANSGEGHLYITGKSNVIIDFNGSTIWCETGKKGIGINKCTNVTLKNVVLDYDKLPFIQGTITGINNSNSTCTVQLDAGYENMTDEMKNAPDVQNASIRFQVLDKGTFRFRKNATGMQCNNFFAGTTGTGPFTVKVNPFGSTTIAQVKLAVGDPFVCMYRNNHEHGIYLSANTNCTLQNVVVRAAPFIAYEEAASSGRTTYRNCKIAPDGDTNRHLASNADGFNAENCEFGPVLDYCEIDSIGDDFFNPHGILLRVLNKIDGTHFQVDRMGYRSSEIVGKKVTVSFLERNTWRDLGTYVCTVSGFGNYTYHAATSLLQSPTGWMAGGLGGLPGEGESVSSHTLITPAPLNLPVDAVLSCDTYASPQAVVTNCRFVNGIAIGIRLQSGDSVVDGNHLESTSSDLVRLTVQPDSFGDSMSPDRAVVKNNLLVDTSLQLQAGDSVSAAIAVLAPGDASSAAKPRGTVAPRLLNNIIRGYIPVHGIYVDGAERGTLPAATVDVLNNRVESYGQATAASFLTGTVPSSLKGYSLYSFYTTGLVFTGNVFTGGGPLAGTGPVLIRP